jgi:NAD(P)-dependent dehydrogenase (short-subunit alcohol dehydrogenase family)
MQTIEGLTPRSEFEDLKGKRVLVTGGTTGIGRAVALSLARAGSRVMVFGRDPHRLEDALKQLEPAGEVYGTRADQSEPEDVKRVFREVDERLGGLDVLINNAADSAHSVTDTPLEEWMYVVKTNLLGYMHCSQEAIPRIRSSGGGIIVNVGSMSAKIREEKSEIYVATKAGIRGFSDSLGKTVADSGIRVCLVEPGLVGTNLSGSSEEEIEQKVREHTMLYADDIARAVVYVLTQPERVAIPLLQIRPVLQKI